VLACGFFFRDTRKQSVFLFARKGVPCGQKNGVIRFRITPRKNRLLPPVPGNS
jgi:hypothetical protein